MPGIQGADDTSGSYVRGEERLGYISSECVAIDDPGVVFPSERVL